MGKLWIPGGGSGAGSGSDECTASKSEVLKGYSAVTSDSDDEPAQGTLELTGDASDGQVLSGKTYYNTDAKKKRNGSMANQGAVSVKLNAGEGYTIPSGFHNGGGKVEANGLASQTPGSATSAHILSGQSAWVNGKRIVGGMTNCGQAQYGNWAVTSSYYAINSLPEGAYVKNGVEWAPEARISKDIVHNSLGISSDKIKAGQKIADIWGSVVENKYFRQEINITGTMNFLPEGYNTPISFGYIEVDTGIDNIQSLYIEKLIDLPVRTAFNGVHLVSTQKGTQYAHYFKIDALNIIFKRIIRIPVEANSGKFVVLVTGH